MLRKSLLLGLCALTVGVVACGRKAAPPSAPPMKGPAVRAVLLYRSVACDCEKARNEQAEGVIANVIAAGAIKPLERLDASNAPAELERYQQLTSISVLPALLALDANGQVVRRAVGFIEEPAARTILAPAAGDSAP